MIIDLWRHNERSRARFSVISPPPPSHYPKLPESCSNWPRLPPEEFAVQLRREYYWVKGEEEEEELSRGVLRWKDVSCVPDSVMCASVTETVANFFPEIEGNLTKISWAHAVNDKTTLNKTLEGELDFSIRIDRINGDSNFFSSSGYGENRIGCRKRERRGKGEGIVFRRFSRRSFINTSLVNENERSKTVFHF